MKYIKNLLGASAILMLALAVTNCTTDSDVVQISEDEINGNEVVESSSSTKAETKAKSSSSKKVEAKSSSSKKEDSKKAENADSKDKSSSSVKEDDSKVSSSSKKDDKEEAKSSSSARKIRVPGIEDPDEVTPASSSSKEKSSSSVKEKPKSSSSIAVKDTIEKDTTVDVTNYDNMDKLDSNEQNILDSLINSGNTSIVKIDSVVNKDTLDFEHNEYLCKAPDGNWYRLKDNVVKSILKVIIDGFYYLVTGNHLYNYTQVCDELYMRRIE